MIDREKWRLTPQGLGAVVAAFVTSLMVLTFIVTPGKAYAAGCARVQVLFVPGTGEVNENSSKNSVPGMLSDMADSLKSQFGSKVDVVNVPYSASIVAKGLSMEESVKTGMNSLKKTISEIDSKCGTDTVYAVTGYSQGAWVAGDFAYNVGNGKGPIPASRFVAGYTLADPGRGPSMKDFTNGGGAKEGIRGDRGSYGAVSDRIGTGCIVKSADGPDMFCAANASKSSLGYNVGKIVTSADPKDINKTVQQGVSLLGPLAKNFTKTNPDIDINKGADSASSLSQNYGDDDAAPKKKSSDSDDNSPDDSKKSPGKDSEPKDEGYGGNAGDLDFGDSRGKEVDKNPGKNDSSGQGGFNQGGSSDKYKGVDPGKRSDRGGTLPGGSGAVDNLKPNKDVLKERKKSVDSQEDDKKKDSSPTTKGKDEDNDSNSGSKGNDDENNSSSDSDSDSDKTKTSTDSDSPTKKELADDVKNVKDTATEMQGVNDNIDKIAGNPENRKAIEDTLRSAGQSDAADIMSTLGSVDYKKLLKLAEATDGDLNKEDLKDAAESAGNLAGAASPIASLSGADSDLTSALGGLTPAVGSGQALNIANGMLDTDWEDIVNSLVVLGQKSFALDAQGAYMTSEHIADGLEPLVTMADGVDFTLISQFVAMIPDPNAKIAAAALQMFDKLNLMELYQAIREISRAAWTLLQNPLDVAGAFNHAMTGGMGIIQSAVKSLGGADFSALSGVVQQSGGSGDDGSTDVTKGASDSESDGSESSADASDPSDSDSADSGNSEPEEGSDSSADKGDTVKSDDSNGPSAGKGSSINPGTVIGDLAQWANFGQSQAKAHVQYGKIEFTTGKTGIEQGAAFLGKFIARA